MPETINPVLLHEYVDSRGIKLAVDAEKGIIEGVKILGLASRNGRTYLKETVARAVPLYEGAKVNINHPAKTDPNKPRDYRDRIGQIRNVRMEQGDGGLFGDFHFNPKHALAEQLVWDAEHAPENVGFSHNVGAKTRRTGQQEIVEEITQVMSVDLVADPATTQGLFEETDTRTDEEEMMDITIDKLKVERPDLVQQIEEAAIKTHVNSEGEKTKQAEQEATVTNMTEELATLKAEKAATERETAIDKLLTEAKLPEAITTEDFLKTVRAMEADKAKQLIENVQSAYKVAGGKPTSTEQHLAEGDETIPNVTDGKSLATAIK